MTVLSVASGCIMRCKLFNDSSIVQSPRSVESNTDNYGDGETPLYFVVDYVEGPTLAEHVQQGRLLPVVAIRLGIHLSEILIYCHQNGIIHRDIKPDNIILRLGNPEDPVLIDFGQSFNKEDSERSTLTSEGQQLGNRFLHLPELQTGDSRKRHVESDISQTCGLIFYALTGKTPGPIVDHEDLKPHQRDSAKPIFDGINSPLIVSLFDKGFERILVRRFRSFDALKGRLHEVLDEFAPPMPFDHDAGTVTLETVTPEIRTSSSQRPQEEAPQDMNATREGAESQTIRDEHFRGENADTFMYASLLGAWNERSEGDREAIRGLIEGDD